MQDSAARIASRLDALASALRAAGLDPARCSHLLETAATAAFDALALEALLEPSVEPAPVEPVAVEPPVRLAA